MVLALKPAQARVRPQKLAPVLAPVLVLARVQAQVVVPAALARDLVAQTPAAPGRAAVFQA